MNGKIPADSSPSCLRRRLLRAALAAPLGALAWTGAAGAAENAYPSRPLKLIIPFPAGGATDYAGRTLGTSLSALWREPIVFDNRAGAGSTIGTDMGAHSPPDGYTLVMGIPAGVTIAPHIYPRLGYKPLVDLVPVAGFATSPLVVVVPADSPFKSFQDLMAFARSHPGEISYASNGSGSLPHLTTEWFLSQAKLRMTHVPYRGSSQALPDLIAGRTQVMIDIIVSALPLIEGGKLRVLAVTGAKPTSRLPGVPTIASLGFPGFASDQWYGIFVPAGTPDAVVRKIEADIARVTADPVLRGQMWRRGAEIQYQPAAAFGASVRTDYDRWAAIAKSSGARAE